MIYAQFSLFPGASKQNSESKTLSSQRTHVVVLATPGQDEIETSRRMKEEGDDPPGVYILTRTLPTTLGVTLSNT